MTACRTCGAPLRVQERARGVCSACRPEPTLRIAWLPGSETWAVLLGSEPVEIEKGRVSWEDKADLLAALKRQGYVVDDLTVRRKEDGED